MNPKFDAILNKMKAMHDKKSQDYANDANRYANFEQTAVAAGISVDAVFRTFIGVKLARLTELQGKGKTPLNESIADSLLDLAVYATLYASYYEELPTALPDTITEVYAEMAAKYKQSGLIQQHPSKPYFDVIPLSGGGDF